MSSLQTILFSLLSGILPALLWLWFWLKEDRLHPEPRSRITLTFLSGMLAVWPAIEIERYFCEFLGQGVCDGNILPSFWLIVFWATTEELLKYLMAFFSSFWKNKYNDEPIDQIIYMITVALGFSALENALFVFNLLDAGHIAQSILTSNTRFLGATLLHVASSSAAGILMAFAYYKKPLVKKMFLFTGLLIAVVLHTIFNLLIIKAESNTFLIFAGVWILIISLIVLIEKIKQIKS